MFGWSTRYSICPQHPTEQPQNVLQYFCGPLAHFGMIYSLKRPRRQPGLHLHIGAYQNQWKWSSNWWCSLLEVLTRRRLRPRTQIHSRADSDVLRFD